MAAVVRILAGPARSGKTTALVERYQKVLAGEPIGQGLWLAPTQHAADDMRGRLVDGPLKGCFSPAVYTFQQFAQAVLAQSDRPQRFIGQMLKRQLIQRIVANLRQANRITYFAPIAETAGLVDLLAGFTSELKRQEIWPEEFGGIVERIGGGPKNSELAAIYSEYQRLLNEHQLYDAEGRFWLARQWLLETPPEHWGRFARLRHIVVDGFSDFTPTQHEILRLLAAKLPKLDELTIALSLEQETGRKELFRKPRATLEELKTRHRAMSIDWQPRSASDDRPAFAYLERHLFDNPRDARPAPHTEGIEIVAAAGPKAEIEWVARRVKELLVRGDAAGSAGPSAASGKNPAQAVKPNEVAVVFRTLEPVAALVAEVFEEYGIPFVLEHRQPLGRSPLLRALLGVLRLQAGDWPFRQLLAVLSNNFFRPAWPQWQSVQSAADVEWAIRQVQVPNDQRKLLAALAQRAEAAKTASDTAADGESPDDAQRAACWRESARYSTALAVLRQSAAALPARHKSHTLADWLGILDGLIARLGMLPSPTATATANDRFASALGADDRRDWQLLKDALAAQIQLDAWLETPPAALTLNELIARLDEVLAVETLPPSCDGIGRVRVISAQDIRALQAPYLFVAGMSEKAFPLPGRDDRIYSPAESRRLIAQGLPFLDPGGRGSDEMLLFYEVATRATRRLVLSYPALDESAQPLSPSPYIIELQRGLGLEASNKELWLSPVPRHSQPYSPMEQRVKAVAELAEQKPQPMAQLLKQTSSGQLHRGAGSFVEVGGQRLVPSENILAALQVIAARSRQDGFSPWEGLLTSKAAKQQLLERFGPQHCWSVSRLEDYALCPFQFFMAHVLNVEPLPEMALEIDYGRRGGVAHDALANLHRRLNADGAHKSPVELGERFSAVTEETLAVLLEQIPQGNSLATALQRLDIRAIARWLGQYLGQHEKYDKQVADFAGLAAAMQGPMRPTHFEVSFGLKRRQDIEVDSLSTEKPFDLVCSDQTVRLSGRIDRIDIGMAQGHVVFNVIDYKTGRKKGTKAQELLNIEAGLALQLPLYAMAVQELLLVDRRAVPWRIGYWFLKEEGAKAGFQPSGLPMMLEPSASGLREADDWQSLRRRLLTRVAELVRGVRDGAFPVYSMDDHCTSHCPYRTVCRIGTIRALEKRWTSTDRSPFGVRQASSP